MEPVPAGVVLRYFPIVGRAQALRHALLDAGVAFEDLRVTRAEWGARRDDPGFGGMFGGLPTLGWGGVTVGETLAIASFLGRRLGHYEGLDDGAVARLEGICSNAYLEVLLKMGELFWADVLYPGVDVGAAFPRHFARMVDKLGRMEPELADGRAWFTGDAPTVADFFAGEAVELQRYFLGPEREEALRARLPRLTALADRIRERPAIARAWPGRPATFSSHPGEWELIAALRAL